ncbi:hypothetical protein SPI_03472 [Niveomyces insectorum RCEF 264]|uniref:Uncharacterized protein n=1 Tax=Niveomyces insectorum RCEF 264 TaxID=1081102 RepID=A0A167W3Y5_9HYPO|nr:hypothetical protein SPI_03472 [Niveomyces insectorum RCEF 264]
MAENSDRMINGAGSDQGYNAGRSQSPSPSSSDESYRPNFAALQPVRIRRPGRLTADDMDPDTYERLLATVQEWTDALTEQCSHYEGDAQYASQTATIQEALDVLEELTNRLYGNMQAGLVGGLQEADREIDATVHNVFAGRVHSNYPAQLHWLLIRSRPEDACAERAYEAAVLAHRLRSATLAALHNYELDWVSSEASPESMSMSPPANAGGESGDMSDNMSEGA